MSRNKASNWFKKGRGNAAILFVVILLLLSECSQDPPTKQTSDRTTSTSASEPGVFQAQDQNADTPVTPASKDDPGAASFDLRSALASGVLPVSPQYRVVHVVDGDTIKVNIGGSKKTIRLVGVDTPETVDPRRPVQCYGIEASKFTKKMIDDALVKLVSDPSQANEDKYGRLLRYVVDANGKMVNYELISQGFAHEYTYDIPYYFQKEFLIAERNAVENERGLWSPDTCAGKTAS